MSSKSGLAIGAVIAAVVVAVVAFYMIDVDQTQEAKLPDVNVDVEGGQLPSYDVQTGSVDVGTEKKTIKVPEVDVNMVEKEITVPSIDVDPAPAD